MSAVISSRPCIGDGTVLAGLKPGSPGVGERYLARFLHLTVGARLDVVPLVDHKFLHLDTVVGALGGGKYLVYLDGLLDPRATLGGALGEAEIIEVTTRDAALSRATSSSSAMS